MAYELSALIIALVARESLPARTLQDKQVKHDSIS